LLYSIISISSAPSAHFSQIQSHIITYFFVEFITIEAVDSSDATTLIIISASLGAVCVLTLLIGILLGCLTTRMHLRGRTGTATTNGHQDLYVEPPLASAAPELPVDMYEDVAPVAPANRPAVPMYEDVTPEVTTTPTRPPVPMYEDIDDVHTVTTTFINSSIIMEENEAYGRKITT
jgi:hypothetical protein